MHIIKHISCGLLLLLVMSDFSCANVRLCGKTLNQFLDMVCVDGFNSINIKAKKSDPLVNLKESSLENDSLPSELSALFNAQLYANHNNLMAKTRRRRRDGVADECCRKPCSIPELLSYCI